jgi:diacylglycerol kinase family enzyme
MSAYSIVNLKEEVEDSLGERAPGIEVRFARKHSTPSTLASPICAIAPASAHLPHPDDPVGALDAFTNGVERLVDVGDVNGRLFLNNVSIGVYGEAVSRSGYRDAKARTLIETVLGPSGSARGVELADDRHRSHRDPTVVLVSNNPYSLDPPAPPGTRSTLDGGELGIVLVDPPGPARAWVAPWLQVSLSMSVHAGIDGEAVTLDPPLLFAIRPRALRVLVP